jgi:hypothetical protein
MHTCISLYICTIHVYLYNIYHAYISMLGEFRSGILRIESRILHVSHSDLDSQNPILAKSHSEVDFGPNPNNWNSTAPPRGVWFLLTEFWQLFPSCQGCCRWSHTCRFFQIQTRNFLDCLQETCVWHIIEAVCTAGRGLGPRSRGQHTWKKSQSIGGFEPTAFCCRIAIFPFKTNSD